jgi:hypothetical protein
MIFEKSVHLLSFGLACLISILLPLESAKAEIILQRQGVLEQGDEVLPSDGSLADIYTFAGQAGQQIRITVESSEFDSYLILIDSERNKLSENDDANRSTHNSELVITLPESGIYTVVVNGYERGEQGEYRLTVSSGTSPASANPSETVLEALPDGDYLYGNGPPLESYFPPAGEEPLTQSIVLRKQGIS